MATAFSIVGLIIVVTIVSAFAFVMWFIGSIIRFVIGGVRMAIGYPARPRLSMYRGPAICLNERCGQPNPPGAAFCRRCGEPIGSAAGIRFRTTPSRTYV